MSLEWKGDALKQKVREASAYGIDQTMAKCIVHAKSNYYPGHGLVTAALQGSIRMKAAVIRVAHVIGQWGSFDINYAENIEKGSGRRPGQGQLQNAADDEYPLLGGRIRKRLK